MAQLFSRHANTISRFSLLFIVCAILIAAFFMHALYESALVRVAISGGVVWFLILITLPSPTT